MNKYLMIAGFAVITTNICGMPLDGNNHKRSFNLSEINEKEGNFNKKAKINKQAQLINILEKEIHKIEEKKERSQQIYGKMKACLFREKELEHQYDWEQKLQKQSKITSSCSSEIHKIRRIIQSIRENPFNSEIPLTFEKAQNGNNLKRSFNLSEINEKEGNFNKKAKINKQAQLINILEKEIHKIEKKKERSKKVYQETMDLYSKEKDDRIRFCYWTPKLEELNNISNACSNEIHTINQVIQSIEKNPSNLEIPLTFGKAQKNVSDEKLTKVVNEAFGVNVSSKEEAESLIWEAFNAFEPYKKGSNILFWNGKAYVNGALSIFPVSDLRIKGKNYHITQLYEILGYERKVIEAMGVISNGFSLLSGAISWFSIRNFWEEAKSRKDSQIDGTLQRHKGLCSRYFHEYIKQTADYIKAARVLGINTKNLAFSSKGLSEPYNKAEEVILEFLKKFSKYIGEFNKEDQKRFIEDMNNTKNLLYEAPALLADYSQYYHTEYMVRYLQKRAERETEPIYAISYYDMCRNCEILFAKSTKEEQDEENTIVVSGYDYKMSRSQGHPHILSNKSFLQVQL